MLPPGLVWWAPGHVPKEVCPSPLFNSRMTPMFTLDIHMPFGRVGPAIHPPFQNSTFTYADLWICTLLLGATGFRLLPTFYLTAQSPGGWVHRPLGLQLLFNRVSPLGATGALLKYFSFYFHSPWGEEHPAPRLPAVQPRQGPASDDSPNSSLASLISWQ